MVVGGGEGWGLDGVGEDGDEVGDSGELDEVAKERSTGEGIVCDWEVVAVAVIEGGFRRIAAVGDFDL